MTGIYGIQNAENGKWYVGQSTGVFTRWIRHQQMLQKGNHHSKELQRDYDEFGVTSQNPTSRLKNDGKLLRLYSHIWMMYTMVSISQISVTDMKWSAWSTILEKG